ncbi:hypothetical protein J5X98_26225 [Leptothermofonsia sichuanensis E412]|nr:hypothetical protein J5X98_26225 [Leptothermofonsia sichuanensis E412]
MISLVQFLIHGVHWLLVPISFVIPWLILFLIGWSLWAAIRDILDRSRQMHRIPCADCRFFTGDYHLKCTVHPASALTEQAIGCPDFESGKRLPLPQETAY